MPLELLKSKFKEGTGKFIFQIDKMPADKRSSRLEIKWKDCVERPLDFLIFGPPSVDVRLFRVLFKTEMTSLLLSESSVKLRWKFGAT